MILPYKYRGVVLLALLVVVLPWAAWRFALRDTFGTWCDCERLTAQLASMAPRPETSQPEAAVAEGPEVVLSGQLLDVVRQTAIDLRVQVAGYEPLVSLQQDGVAVHTALLTLTGSYTSLLRVAGELERTQPQCRLRSLAWHNTIDRRTRRTQLTLTLYIQQIVLEKQQL